MKAEYASEYGRLEREHWWFRVRRIILKGLLDRHAGWRSGMKVVEIGIGPGENLYSLYPAGVDLAGVEPDRANAGRAAVRGPVPVYVGCVEQMPREMARGRQDMVCMFDVLEHIRDDDGALERVAELLCDGGRLALSVPAYQWMWGQQDEVNMHCRRYTRAQLCRKLKAHGFEIIRATYFNTFLFPPIAVIRLAARLVIRKRHLAQSDFRYSAGILDFLLYGLFRLEWPLLKHVSFPFGGSCFILARYPRR